MVRTALAQIFYKPAIVEKHVDYLAEPGILLHGTCTASLLENFAHNHIATHLMPC